MYYSPFILELYTIVNSKQKYSNYIYISFLKICLYREFNAWHDVSKERIVWKNNHFFIIFTTLIYKYQNYRFRIGRWSVGSIISCFHAVCRVWFSICWAVAKPRQTAVQLCGFVQGYVPVLCSWCWTTLWVRIMILWLFWLGTLHGKMLILWIWNYWEVTRPSTI